MLENNLFAEEQEADKTNIMSSTAVKISIEKNEENLNKNQTSPESFSEVKSSLDSDLKNQNHTSTISCDKSFSME